MSDALELAQTVGETKNGLETAIEDVQEIEKEVEAVSEKVETVANISEAQNEANSEWLLRTNQRISELENKWETMAQNRSTPETEAEPTPTIALEVEAPEPTPEPKRKALRKKTSNRKKTLRRK